MLRTGHANLGHSNPILDHATLQRADKASNEALMTISRIQALKNRGPLTCDDLEVTLLLMISKYFNALVDEAMDPVDVRERYEAFCQGLQITFEEALDGKLLVPSSNPAVSGKCICRLSPASPDYACSHH